MVNVPAVTVGDAANYMLENTLATIAFNEGSALYVDLPAAVELTIAEHRARPAGRPLHRRHQARHAGDRRRDQGAAVHHHRREGQGRHPQRRIPRPGLRCRHAARHAGERSTSSSRPRRAAEDPLKILAERVERAGAAGERVHLGHRRGRRPAPARIDELITTYSEGWTLDRMPAVDRNLLRGGTYELLWMPDVPEGVVISEWVHLAARAVDRRVAAVRQRSAGPLQAAQAQSDALTALTALAALMATGARPLTARAGSPA